MHRLKNASRAAMTRSKLKQPNYSLSDRDPGDALKGIPREARATLRVAAL
jgi:hypothetical protein